MNRKTLIIGGTGTIGQSIVDLMQKGKNDFVVLARTAEKATPLNEKGVKTVIGSLGDWPSIKAALVGIDQVFLLTSPSPQQVEWQNGLIDAAKELGVQKIVKISAIGARTGSSIHLANWHGQTEAHLKNSGLQYVILQPHSFMQNTLMSLPTIKAQSAIYQSLGDAKIPMVDTRDVAKASYASLVSNDFNGKTFEITGSQSVGYADMAKSLSKATGKEINYVSIPPASHNAAMKEAGLPDWLADDLTSMSAYWSKKPVHEPSKHFEEMTGARAYTIDQFAQDYADLFK